VNYINFQKIDFSEPIIQQPRFIDLEVSFYKQYSKIIYENKMHIQKISFDDHNILKKCLFCGHLITDNLKRGRNPIKEMKKHFQNVHGNLLMALSVDSSIKLVFESKNKNKNKEIYFSKYGQNLNTNRALSSDFYLNERVMLKLKDEIVNYNI
jgi:hypothetical protein